MTKSNILIIGNDPARLLERHRACYDCELRDVTSALQALASTIADTPSPAGIAPSALFKAQLAARRAAAQFFGDAHYWVYDARNPPPSQFILHNHVVLEGSQIVAAFSKAPNLSITPNTFGYWHNNPFDSYRPPAIAYLPLRPKPAARPYHPRTVTSPLQPYYADTPSAVGAALRDIDRVRIAQARWDRIDDLLTKSDAALRNAGFYPAYDWTPRYPTDEGTDPRDAAYLQQDKVRLLVDRLPEHARNIDFLLLDREDLRLHAEWAWLPVAGLITQDRYTDMSESRGDPTEARFRQITGTTRSFLRALCDAWRNAHEDTLASIYLVHE